MSRFSGWRGGRRSGAASTVAALVATGLTVVAAPSAAQEPLTLSSRTQAGVLGNAASGTFGVSLSADGSTVAFSSLATNLSPEDTDAEADVYVTSLDTGALRVVSTSSSGRKASTFSVRPSLDGRGTTVAFLSASDDLHPDDTDGFTDVFVKDLVSGELLLASAGPTGRSAGANSGPPDLSTDGRRVAFVTAARLTPEDSGTTADLYVKDLRSGAVHLASRRADGSGAELGRYGIGLPSLSGDGTRVAFDTDAPLDSRDTDTAPDVYVKDLVSGQLVLASLTADGVNSTQGSFRPALSDDGTRVAFDSFSTDLSAEDPLEDADVYVKDLASGRLFVVSTTSSGAGVDGRSTDASLSGDGRRVAFSSEAALGPHDGTVLQTWLKDLDTGAVALVSTDGAGAPSGTLTISPRVSADGSTVAFTTPAALLPADTNGWADVYVRRVQPAPPPLPPVDTEGPVLSLRATPDVLPAARRTPLTISGSAADGGSGLSVLTVTVCDEHGRVLRVFRPRLTDGQASTTWTTTVLLPGQSRPRDRDGREFTIWATARDEAGNTARTGLRVATAPHRRRGAGRVDPSTQASARTAAAVDRDRGNA